MTLSKDLLQEAKNYLDLTWDDPDGDNKLSGILMRGIEYLDQTAGATLDYTTEGKPKELLFDYARYVRANALDEFQHNYLHELLTLQIYQEIKEYGSKQE